MEPPRGGSVDCVRGGATNNKSICWQRCPNTRTQRWTPRTTANGHRRQSPAPGRWRSKLRTPAYGHRRLLHRGARRGILAEPGPQRSHRSRRHFSGNCLPTLGLPVLAGALGEQVDSSALRFLTASALEAKRKLEEEEEPKRRREQTAEDEARLELRLLLAVHSSRHTAEQERRLTELARLVYPASSSARRKKRKKVPKSSSSRSYSSWSVSGCRLRSARHLDSPGVAVVHVDNGSGMFLARWYTGHAVFPSFVDRPVAWHHGWFGPEGQFCYGSFAHGWFCCLRCTSRCVSSFDGTPWMLAFVHFASGSHLVVFASRTAGNEVQDYGLFWDIFWNCFRVQRLLVSQWISLRGRGHPTRFGFKQC